tara:strand:- start:482 stop:718 length:237 start_codon:yes stop_codon:yes gene_type:complete
VKIINIPGCVSIGKALSEPSQKILGRFHRMGIKIVEVEAEGDRSYMEIVKTNGKDNPYFLKTAKAEDIDKQQEKVTSR